MALMGFLSCLPPSMLPSAPRLSLPAGNGTDFPLASLPDTFFLLHYLWTPMHPSKPSSIFPTFPEGESYTEIKKKRRYSERDRGVRETERDPAMPSTLSGLHTLTTHPKRLGLSATFFS